MQDENFIAWGFHCPLLDKTFKSLQSINNLVHSVPLKDSLLDGLGKRFPDFKCARNVLATMIHPAFKKDYLVKNIEGVDVEAATETVIQLLDEIKAAANEASNVNRPQHSSISHPQLRHLSLFYDDSEIEDGSSQSDSRLLLESFFQESDKSLAMLLMPKYDSIKKLFIRYNTQLLSSASSERLFSIGRLVLTYTRTSLADDMFEKLVLLNASSKKK